MSPIPDFIVEMRELIGHHPLWLPGVTAVITRGDGHVLLVKRSDNGAWTPVTGIVDPGEEPAIAAAREALEETGVVISVDRLAATTVLPELTYDNGDRAAYLDLTFACTWLSGEAYVADDESTDVRWWPIDDLPPMSPHMASRIEAGLSDEREARFVGKAPAEQRRPCVAPGPAGARRRRLPRRLGRRADRARGPAHGPRRRDRSRTWWPSSGRRPSRRSWRSTSRSDCPTAADVLPTPRPAVSSSASRRRSSRR